MDTIRQIIHDPVKGLSTSTIGALVSMIDSLSPVLRFIILICSAVTALSVAYVHFSKAKGGYVKKNKKNTKGNRNSR